MTDVHVVLTTYGDLGWAIHSPQLPGLVGGRATADSIIRDTADILMFAGIGNLPEPRVITHEEHALEDPAGNEYLVRFADDEHAEERARLAGYAGAAIVAGAWSDSDRAQQRTLDTGERLVISAVRSDSLSWIRDQLREKDVATMIVIAQEPDEQAGPVIWNMPYSVPGFDSTDGYNPEALGLTPESTIEDAIRATMAADVERMGQRLPKPDRDVVHRELTRV
ncbi:hypothetical protein [Tsukamurella paurometabola]|uniref:Uncharacterized protein n=1 Tax=Tsukamurella paurometabola TaxID=2061 RepID=A0A3P8M9F4_TSUPA|nr:hypothetical protein [Tsukamurella paurometabola]UEA84455.1 hypothetical protein LK411_06425 [Tsukamurella paurometabola]VDR37020.1 Uncharacterised protein [Tsukamurella paurometabola]